MKITNMTKQIILAADSKKLTSLIGQTLGMLPYKKPQALILKTHFGIHTFLMKYPIDVLILNKNNEVNAIKQNMQPNTIFIWNPKFTCVIELPPGIIKSSNTQLYDKISF